MGAATQPMQADKLLSEHPHDSGSEGDISDSSGGLLASQDANDDKPIAHRISAIFSGVGGSSADNPAAHSSDDDSDSIGDGSLASTHHHSTSALASAERSLLHTTVNPELGPLALSMSRADLEAIAAHVESVRRNRMWFWWRAYLAVALVGAGFSFMASHGAPHGEALAHFCVAILIFCLGGAFVVVPSLLIGYGLKIFGCCCKHQLDVICGSFVAPSLFAIWRTKKPYLFEWPTPDEVRKKLEKRKYDMTNDHMRLGMSRHGFRDAVLMIATGYVRPEHGSKQGWFVEVYSTCINGVFVGYDFLDAIRVLWEKLGYEDFSVAEVFFAMGHPGVGFANTFLSHMQIEALSDTFKALKNVAERWFLFEPIYWIDYTSLRQLQLDFDFDVVESTIRKIGRTAVVTAQLGAEPQGVTRSFCLFEWWATLKTPAAEFVIAPINNIGAGAYFRPGRKYTVNCREAERREKKHKSIINENIRKDIGFEKFEGTVADAIASAERTILWWSASQLVFLGLALFAAVLIVGTVGQSLWDAPISSHLISHLIFHLLWDDSE